jgi:hypothetical protein
MTPTTPPPYIAHLKNAPEVTLTGRADLAYWQARLAGSGLAPLPRDGQAELWLSAVQSHWLGLPFQELAISITVHAPDDGRGDRPVAPTIPCAYLLHAYNSHPILAWSERTFFQTPYLFAGVRLQARPPACLTLREIRVEAMLPFYISVRPEPGLALEARMGAERPPLRQADEIWEGVIHLPRIGVPPRRFYARLGGLTATYPFDPTTDRLELADLADLCESGFTPTEWRLREKAHHARSRTYPERR